MRITKIEDLRIGQTVYDKNGNRYKIDGLKSNGTIHAVNLDNCNEIPVGNIILDYFEIYSEPPKKKVKKTFYFCSFAANEEYFGAKRINSNIYRDKFLLPDWKNEPDYQEHQIEIEVDE